MKKCFLFSGAVWTVVRFMVLYFALFSVLKAGEDAFAGLLLFSFGSLHAVMTAGYIMTGFYGERYPGVLKLLAAGQVFAVCADAAVVLSLGAAYGTLPVFPAGVSPLAVLAGMAGVDVLFFFGLIIRRPGHVHKPENPSGPVGFPEVHEVSLEEE